MAATRHEQFFTPLAFCLPHSVKNCHSADGGLEEGRNEGDTRAEEKRENAGLGLLGWRLRVRQGKGGRERKYETKEEENEVRVGGHLLRYLAFSFILIFLHTVSLPPPPHSLPTHSGILLH